MKSAKPNTMLYDTVQKQTQYKEQVEELKSNNTNLASTLHHNSTYKEQLDEVSQSIQSLHDEKVTLVDKLNSLEKINASLASTLKNEGKSKSVIKSMLLFNELLKRHNWLKR